MYLYTTGFACNCPFDPFYCFLQLGGWTWREYCWRTYVWCQRRWPLRWYSCTYILFGVTIIHFYNIYNQKYIVVIYVWLGFLQWLEDFLSFFRILIVYKNDLSFHIIDEKAEVSSNLYVLFSIGFCTSVERYMWIE